MENKVYLGIDIGGTSCKVGLVNSTGEVLINDEFSVSFDQYQTPILETVKKGVKQFLDKHPQKLAGIGVSATGQVDVNSGTIIGSAGHIEHWIDSNIKQELQTLFQVPVTVVNDANCMMLGEVWQGVARGVKNVVGLTLGTGVGGGILVNGELLLGERGIAGELGHMTLHGDQATCYCGMMGCYELYASTTALVKLVNREVGAYADGKAIFDDLNNPKVYACYKTWVNDIAMGIASLVHIFNPSLVVIGGGVSSQTRLIEDISKRVKELVMPCFRECVSIEKAQCGNLAGLLGAIYYHLTHEIS